MATRQDLGEAARQYLEKKMNDLEDGIVGALHYAGLEAVTKARKNVAKDGDAKPRKPIYTVRTGNLVSSTGYVLLRNGMKQQPQFPQFTAVAGKYGDGKEGSDKGKSFAEQEANNGNVSGIRLVVVAGMPYAKYLQAKGWDVLNSAQLVAEKAARKKINDVIKSLKD